MCATASSLRTDALMMLRSPLSARRSSAISQPCPPPLGAVCLLNCWLAGWLSRLLGFYSLVNHLCGVGSWQQLRACHASGVCGTWRLESPSMWQCGVGARVWSAAPPLCVPVLLSRGVVLLMVRATNKREWSCRAASNRGGLGRERSSRRWLGC